MRLFHISSANAIPGIKSSGIRPTRVETRPKVQKYHMELDRMARKKEIDWIRRRSATYLYPSPEPAHIHTGRHLHSIVVEVETDAEVLCAPTKVVEGEFHRYGKGESDLERVLSETCRPNVAQGDDRRYEAWTQNRIPPTEIVEVYDHEELKRKHLLS